MAFSMFFSLVYGCLGEWLRLVSFNSAGSNSVAAAAVAAVAAAAPAPVARLAPVAVARLAPVWAALVALGPLRAALASARVPHGH